MTNTTDVFVSHNWGLDELGRDNHTRVSIINEELKRLGYKTWFDGDKMTGDIEDQMTKEIEKAKCVIVFMIKKYYGKVNGEILDDNCKLEFSHAKRMKKSGKMLAIVMEPCMTKAKEWEGQVGMQLGGKVYVNMSKDVKDETYLRNQIKDLEEELRSMGIQPMNISDSSTENKEPESGIFYFSLCFFNILA